MMDEGGDKVAEESLDDARDAVKYLVVPESRQHIAIMEVLETSVTDLNPREVATRLRAAGTPLDEAIIESRLDQLRDWGAVSARTDASRILRHADLLARNWRYTATPIGRHVQRFYRTVLAGAQIVREIPLASLGRVVDAAEALARADGVTADPELIGKLFVSHDDLDSALVGAEDSLAGLADRFDLDLDTTAELKTLLVNYATHVASELDRGAERAHRALCHIRHRFAALAAAAVSASDARALIERGALAASRGGRVEDWEGLLVWCDPDHGRAARFGLRLVRALPSMHLNLRRLHTSSGTATSRGRLLALARACRDPQHGPSILVAALGDHPWRKLHGVSHDDDQVGAPFWREAPRVEVPELLRLTGRGGARGRVPAARDDGPAREAVGKAREQRSREHRAAVEEIIGAAAGEVLSERAGRVALAALLVAVRSRPAGDRRTGQNDGLACTLFHVVTADGALRAPSWAVITPGRIPVFHRVGAAATPPLQRTVEDPEHGARIRVLSPVG